MIFNVPPYCPVGVIRGETEYMGWVASYNQNNIHETDRICSRLANRHPRKTFLRIRPSFNSNFAIQHRCMTEGDFFRVFGNKLFYGEGHSYKCAIINNMQQLGNRKTFFPNISSWSNNSQDSDINSRITNGGDLASSNNRLDMYPSSTYTCNSRSCDNAENKLSNDIEPEFSKLAITHSSLKTNKSQIDLTIMKKIFRSVKTQTDLSLLAYNSQINSQKTPIRKQNFTLNKIPSFKEKSRPNIKIQIISRDNKIIPSVKYIPVVYKDHSKNAKDLPEIGRRRSI